MHRLEAYTTLALIFIAIITVFYLPIMFTLKRRGISMMRQSAYLGLFCSLFLIVFATILFMPINFKPETYVLNLIPFLWIENANQFIIEKIPNILVFIPLGFFIPIVFRGVRKWYKIITVSFIVTFSIEFLQYFIGRSSDIDDIIMNLIGAIIGYITYKLLNKIFYRKNHWNILLNNNKN